MSKICERPVSDNRDSMQLSGSMSDDPQQVKRADLAVALASRSVIIGVDNSPECWMSSHTVLNVAVLRRGPAGILGILGTGMACGRKSLRNDQNGQYRP